MQFYLQNAESIKPSAFLSGNAEMVWQKLRFGRIPTISASVRLAEAAESTTTNFDS